ncbi:MAG: hypothetical protein KDD60_12560, partial [Bdellovibrionales bacterium]|nr:hypothetical protein [Bdellovibrionales bacterium]
LENLDSTRISFLGPWATNQEVRLRRVGDELELTVRVSPTSYGHKALHRINLTFDASEESQGSIDLPIVLQKTTDFAIKTENIQLIVSDDSSASLRVWLTGVLSKEKTTPCEVAIESEGVELFRSKIQFTILGGSFATAKLVLEPELVRKLLSMKQLKESVFLKCGCDSETARAPIVVYAQEESR